MTDGIKTLVQRINTSKQKKYEEFFLNVFGNVERDYSLFYCESLLKDYFGFIPCVKFSESVAKEIFFSSTQRGWIFPFNHLEPKIEKIIDSNGNITVNVSYNDNKDLVIKNINSYFSPEEIDEEAYWKNLNKSLQNIALRNSDLIGKYDLNPFSELDNNYFINSKCIVSKNNVEIWYKFFLNSLQMHFDNIREHQDEIQIVEDVDENWSFIIGINKKIFIQELRSGYFLLRNFNFYIQNKNSSSFRRLVVSLPYWERRHDIVLEFSFPDGLNLNIEPLERVREIVVHLESRYFYAKNVLHIICDSI